MLNIGVRGACARWIRYSVVVTCLTALLVPNLRGQTTVDLTIAHTPPGIAPGAPSGSYPLSGFDTVNLYNGNLNFALPLVEVRGRGQAQYTMTLPIEQRWRIERYYTSPNSQPVDYPVDTWWNGIAVGYGPGTLLGRRTAENPTSWECNSPVYGRTITRLTFTRPDGTEYELIDQQTGGSVFTVTYDCPAPPDNGAFRGKVFVTRDGTAATFISDTDIFDINYRLSGEQFYPTGDLVLRDGTRYRIEEGLVTWIRDRNGNVLQLTYDSYSRVSTITDSLKRQITVTYYDFSLNRLYDEISFKGFGGAARAIRIWYELLGEVLYSGELQTVHDLFPETQTPDDSIFNPLKVSSVELPDGRSYAFYYNSHGELALVQLPTGGKFEYEFSGFVGSGIAYPTTMVYRRVVARRVYIDGVQERRTTYSIPSSYVNTIVEVDDRDSNSKLLAHAEHYFHGTPVNDGFLTPFDDAAWDEGKEFQTDVFDTDGANKTALLRRLAHTWQNAAPPGGPRIIESVTTLADTNQVKKETTIDPATLLVSYDVYNNRTGFWEYDYGQGAAGDLLRSTRTMYVTFNNGQNYAADLGIHLRNLPAQETVFDATGAQRSQTTFEYDNYTPGDNKHAALIDRIGPDPQHPLISQLDPTFTTSYVKRGNVTSTGRWLDTDNSWINTYQQYDVAGNVVKTIDARGNASNFVYGDDFGAPDGEARSNSAPAELAGQTSFAFPTQMSNPLGHVSYTQYDYFLDKPVDAEDTNGVVTSAFYNDPLDRITLVIRANNTDIRNQTSFTYNDPVRLITTTGDLNAYLDNLLKSELLYDGFGRLLQSRQFENLNGEYIGITQYYHAMGRVRQVSTPALQTSGYMNMLWTSYEYDALGRNTRVKTPDGAMVDSVYQGNEVVVIDQSGKQRVSTTDALGRLVKVIEDPAVPGETHLEYQTSYTYDALDNLKTVEQGAQRRTFVYDSLSRLKSAENPESGMISYDYDANGNLRHKTDARGTITYDYDPLNRLTSRSYTDGTAVTFAYDAPGVAYSKGRLTSVSSVSSTVSSHGYDEYDALGRVKRSSQVTDGNQYPFSYGYNLAGGMTSQTYPSGRTVTTSYDGRTLSSVASNDKAYASSIGYAWFGTAKAMRLGNGLWEHTRFNYAGPSLTAYGRLQPIEIGLGTSVTDSSVLRLDYDYGTTTNNGNVLSERITVPGMTPLTQFYAYDSANRLETATERSSGWEALCPDSSSVWCQKFGYDNASDPKGAWGNRRIVARSNLGVSTLEPTTFASNNRIADLGWLYDSSGNVIKNPLNPLNETFVYDLENRMTAYCKQDPAGCVNEPGAGRTLYGYDGEGRRVKKVEAGVTTTFVYNVLGQLVAEYSSQPTTGTGGTSYLTTDHLGSIRVITDDTGAVKKRYDYLPFGEEIGIGIGGRTTNLAYGTADNTRQLFTGKERDGESGLDYFLARYCSGAQGRFTSPDPLLGSAHIADPQTWNRYTYGLNNPLRNTDPLGLWDWDVSAGGSYTDEELEARSRDRNLSRRERNKARNALAFRVRFRGALDAAGDAAEASGQSIVQESVAAYGNENDNNGVIVGVRPAAGGNPAGTLLNDIDTITVMFNPSLRGNDLVATLGHEGRHVADAQAYVKTDEMRLGPFDLTHYALEQRGWLVSSYVAQALGMRYYPRGAGDRPAIQVWNRGWTGADRQTLLRSQGINNLIRQFYGFTPESPGNRYSQYHWPWP